MTIDQFFTGLKLISTYFIGLSIVCMLSYIIVNKALKCHKSSFKQDNYTRLQKSFINCNKYKKIVT